MEKKTFLGLTLILIGAFLLRFVFLTSNPPSLNWDEISHGYNAFSILKTGSDEWGQVMPISNFRAYGDYPLPLNLYITLPFVLFFGLTDFAIRLPHVIMGSLMIISTYFVAWGLTKNKFVSFLSAILVAISPWTLFTSRFVLQSNVSVLLLTTSLAFFLNREYSKKLVTASFALLGLSLFAYNTTRIISPLILVTIWLLYKEKIWSLKNRIILALFFIPIALVLMGSNSRARSSVVSIIDSGAIARIEDQRNTSNLPPLLNKLTHNRPVYFLNQFFKNYVGYFSPTFLFFKGGTQYQFSVPNFGLLYQANLPFFYLGLFILIRESIKKQKNYQMLLAILLIAPIPAAMTNEKFAVLRSSAMLPIPMILSSIGLYYLYELLNRKHQIILMSSYTLLSIVLMTFYFNNYFYKYPISYSSSWQYGYKEVAEYIKENDDKYAKIVMTKKYGEPHEYMLFYLQYDPQLYKNDKNLNRFYQSNWWWVDGFGKFYFVNDWQIPKDGYKFLQESKKIVDCKQAKCLLVTSPNNAPTGWSKIKTINFLNGEVAFELYEND